MSQRIVVAGATGNLGNRICRELAKRKANVVALARPATDADKKAALEKLGVEVIEVDMGSVADMAKACAGAACLVSAVAGLQDVIVDLQKRLVQAALQAGVARFIPSDFCTDYTNLVRGENRNFDLRREFRDYLDTTSLQATSIFNGAFAEILQYGTPVLNLKDKSIGYWGDKHHWKLDFTTMDDTAAFTAEAALDDAAPRNLPIASFQVSPADLQADVKEASGKEFRLQPMGSLEDFGANIKKQRAENPAGENELYARWQQAQYVYSMFSTHHQQLANDRYTGLTWTNCVAFLQSFMK